MAKKHQRKHCLTPKYMHAKPFKRGKANKPGTIGLEKQAGIHPITKIVERGEGVKTQVSILV